MKMDDTTSTYIKKIENFLCKILWALGLWIPYGESKTRIILYSSYSIIFLFIFSLMYTVFLVINIFLLTDFDDLTNRLYMSLTEAALVIKVINFFVNNREWQKILTEISAFRIDLFHDEPIIRKRARIFQIILYVYFLIPNCAVYTIGLVPLFTGSVNLIFSGYYPGLDWKNNRKDYWSIYVYQYIGIVLTCNINVAIDSYYCFMMHILSTQINIFGHRLSRMKIANKEKDSILKTRLEFIEKFHMHQRLNSIFELIQKNLQWAYFCQVLLSGIVICSVTKELTEVSNSFLPIFK